jgi:hypothetical protein
LAFPLQLRIPAWASGTTITVNGSNQQAPRAGSFARVERTWKAGDRVEITFPMRPRVSRWFNDSVAIERGPLVFSYPVGESWVKLRDRGMTADWQIYPSTPWNYALQLDMNSPAASISVVESEVGDIPFSRKTVPVQLRIKARKLPSWRAEDGVANSMPQSPVASNEVEEEITLVPYATAKLRITAFPVLKS